MEDQKSIFDQIRKRGIPTPDTLYFEVLVHQVEAKRSQKPTKVIPIGRKIMYWSCGAAAAFLLAYIVISPENEKEVNLMAQLKEIPTDEIFNYVELHLDEFDTDLIVSALPSENIERVEFMQSSDKTTTVQEPVSNAIDFNSLEEQDILDYLESMGLESSDLDDIEI